MQAVQTSQAALDLAQEKYDEALQKQAKTKTAMVEIEKKLATLRENGKLLVRFLAPWTFPEMRLTTAN